MKSSADFSGAFRAQPSDGIFLDIKHLCSQAEVAGGHNAKSFWIDVFGSSQHRNSHSAVRSICPLANHPQAIHQARWCEQDGPRIYQEVRYVLSQELTYQSSNERHSMLEQERVSRKPGYRNFLLHLYSQRIRWSRVRHKTPAEIMMRQTLAAGRCYSPFMPSVMPGRCPRQDSP
jgi:hypothetical protein